MSKKIFNITVDDQECITIIYKEKVLKAYSEIFETVKNPRHAKILVKELKKITKNAEFNLGYSTGYYPEKEAEELRKRFGISHPFINAKSS